MTGNLPGCEIARRLRGPGSVGVAECRNLLLASVLHLEAGSGRAVKVASRDRDTVCPTDPLSFCCRLSTAPSHPRPPAADRSIRRGDRPGRTPFHRAQAHRSIAAVRTWVARASMVRAEIKKERKVCLPKKGENVVCGATRGPAR